MDAFRTPFLDFFRRGEVARDIRLVAAQGALAPRAHEQLALLVLLVGDADAEVAMTAEHTLQSIPAPALAAFLARSDVPTELRAFFAERGVLPSTTAVAADVTLPLVDAAPEPPPEPEGVEADGDTDRLTSTLSRIAAMSPIQRISLALKGTREERAVLIRDSNKLVSMAVLSSPKIGESEVESISKMANVSEEVLRVIGGSRAWMKNYSIAVSLAKNPKTPVALSMNLLSRLNDRDLKALCADRNVPDVLRVTARKKIVVPH
ncbi:MAG: hypothetical protein HOP14_12695 [Acidobacteria bacterium]|nr:hypothetical protein [Acidobacteriota bacterium]